MTSRKNQDTARDNQQQGSSNIELDDFRRRFSEFLVAHNLDERVTTPQVAGLFEIVQAHMAEKASWETARKAILLRDHRECEKLIKGIRKRLNDFVDYLNQANKANGPLTTSLARSSIEKLTPKPTSEPRSEPTLQDLLATQEVIIRSQKAVLSMVEDTAKNADRELTIDLLNFIEEEFPGCTELHRNVLIGATLAGAGVYDDKTLAVDAGPIQRVPMKVSRARKRIEGLYSVPGSERNNPAVIARRKKERLQRQNVEVPVGQPVEEKTK